MAKTLKRAPKEILDRIVAIEGDDFFGFQRYDLIKALPYNEAKEFLKTDAIKKYDAGEKEWRQEDDPLGEIVEYMPFALDKAKNHRGLSASRSVDHIEAWIWLSGNDDLLSKFNAAPYANYGVPQLKVAGEALGIKLPTNEEWFKNMSQGRRCHDPECYDGGCGS
jgi:hypothetical protein